MVTRLKNVCKIVVMSYETSPRNRPSYELDSQEHKSFENYAVFIKMSVNKYRYHPNNKSF